ncbi:hypothetical protein P3342_006379 [Pyrenophora teres f. teres]|nr:hypothetical protein P3342_006379 [Pyrenophora teres f. teres]
MRRISASTFIASVLLSSAFTGARADWFIYEITNLLKIRQNVKFEIMGAKD